jgi:hypothetical protein
VRQLRLRSTTLAAEPGKWELNKAIAIAFDGDKPPAKKFDT